MIRLKPYLASAPTSGITTQSRKFLIERFLSSDIFSSLNKIGYGGEERRRDGSTERWAAKVRAWLSKVCGKARQSPWKWKERASAHGCALHAITWVRRGERWARAYLPSHLPPQTAA